MDRYGMRRTGTQKPERGELIDMTMQSETVDHQSHYEQNGVEPIDYMRANFTAEELRGFYLGNIIKYVSRYRKKDGIKDLEKARVYLDWLIEHEKAQDIKRSLEQQARGILSEDRMGWPQWPKDGMRSFVREFREIPIIPDPNPAVDQVGKVILGRKVRKKKMPKRGKK